MRIFNVLLILINILLIIWLISIEFQEMPPVSNDDGQSAIAVIIAPLINLLLIFYFGLISIISSSIYALKKEKRGIQLIVIVATSIAGLITGIVLFNI